MRSAISASFFRRPQISLRSFRVWQRNRDVYLKLWKSELIWPLVEPLVTLFALGLGLGGMVQLSSGQDYMHFIAPGMLAVWPMWAAAGECVWNSYFRMESNRTFDAIISTPVSIEDVITGEVMWGASRGFISALYILVIITAFGAVSSGFALLALPFSILVGLMFAAISISYTSVARSISSLNYFFAIFITPQFWLGGAFFPREELPTWAEKASWWLPASHVVDIYRGIIDGELNRGHFIDLAWIIVAIAIFYLIAIFSMRWRLVR